MKIIKPPSVVKKIKDIKKVELRSGLDKAVKNSINRAGYDVPRPTTVDPANMKKGSIKPYLLGGATIAGAGILANNDPDPSATWTDKMPVAALGVLGANAMMSRNKLKRKLMTKRPPKTKTPLKGSHIAGAAGLSALGGGFMGSNLG